MKPYRTTILFIIFTTLLAVSCSEWNLPGREEAGSSFIAHNLRDDFLSDLDDLTSASQYTLDVKISLEDEIMRLTGTQEIHYTNQEDESLNTIYLRLFPNISGDYLSISDLIIDGEKVHPIMEHNNTTARLVLPEPLAPGESLVIFFKFNSIVPNEMGGNYGLYVYTDGILALDAFFPIIPAYEVGQWQVEEPSINADMLFTDVAFYTVTVNAPEDYVIAAGGYQVHREISAGRQIITYQGGPQRDFYLAASPHFVSVSENYNGVKVTSYFLEQFRSAGKRVLEISIDSLEAFESRMGLYPYNELDLVSTPMLAGGMEYSGITALGINFYDPQSVTSGGLPGSVFLEAATAHEIAHMWFYGQVMSDQIDEPWMDESLVQYITSLYYLHAYGQTGQNDFIDSFYGRWDRVERDPIPIGKAAAEYSPLEYGAIVYGRGALFFADLHDLMGAEAFNAFLADYVSTYRWGIAHPQDMLTLAADACDCDLEPLLQEYGILK